MKGALAVLDFVTEAAARGERSVIVTLTDVIGGASRAPGAHMAVSESGASIGSFSGGCIEAAVIGEALETLDRGKARRVRFGAGSPYIDIRLPCGGGIDLLFTPEPGLATVEEAAHRLAARKPVALLLTADGGCAVANLRPAGWSADGFTARHDPDLRILIAGHGEEAIALARLARASALPVAVCSPDQETLRIARSLGAETGALVSISAPPDFDADPFTAITFLFHDHDWEGALLPLALASPAFFVGAMGSRATHDRRKAALEDRGVPLDDIARIIGPIGLLPRSRDPGTLAISILAQIVQMAEAASYPEAE